MNTKVLEVRDEGTCISVLALLMAAANPIESAFLRREGYPQDGTGVVLMKLYDQKATSDPYGWPSLGGGRRTMTAAHDYIIKHWGELLDGDVVDVRVALGEATEPCKAEIFV